MWRRGWTTALLKTLTGGERTAQNVKKKKSQYEEGVAKTHTRMPHHVFMPISMNKEEERKSTYTHKEKKKTTVFFYDFTSKEIKKKEERKKQTRLFKKGRKKEEMDQSMFVTAYMKDTEPCTLDTSFTSFF